MCYFFSQFYCLSCEICFIYSTGIVSFFQTKKTLSFVKILIFSFLYNGASSSVLGSELYSFTVCIVMYFHFTSLLWVMICHIFDTLFLLVIMLITFVVDILKPQLLITSLTSMLRYSKHFQCMTESHCNIRGLRYSLSTCIGRISQ